MKMISFIVGDRLQFKKGHPCGCDVFKVMRTGTDVRVVCEGCGRDLTLGREKLEKKIKKVL